MSRITSTPSRLGLSSYNSALSVTILVALVYSLFTLLALSRHDWNPMWFVWEGERYRDLDPEGRTGYDGQFIYYLARDGEEALPHLDTQGYRLQRIFLPVLVRLISFGNPATIPWLIPLVNLLAIVATSYLLARWLEGRSLSPWYALIYGLYVGTLMAYSRDLTEPLALFLGAWGATLWLSRRNGWSVLLLALAALTKEITLLFIAGIFLSELLSRRLKPALATLIAVIPLLVWEMFLYQKYGYLPILSGPPLEAPLIGILPDLSLEPGVLSAFLFVALPGLLLLIYAIYGVAAHRGQDPVSWWLLLHAALVLVMPFMVYNHIMHAGRNAAGMLIALVLILPQLRPVLRLFGLSYFVLPTFVWIAPILRWAPWLSEI